MKSVENFEVVKNTHTLCCVVSIDKINEGKGFGIFSLKNTADTKQGKD